MNATNIIDLDTMTNSYAECALWSSMHFESEEDACGTSFDEVDAGISEKCRENFRKDCRDFLDVLEREGIEIGDAMTDEQMGHDFWLTRNGHGAGFWDRGLGTLGDRLTKWAEVPGSCDLYLGGDGLIYCD